LSKERGKIIFGEISPEMVFLFFAVLILSLLPEMILWLVLSVYNLIQSFRESPPQSGGVSHEEGERKRRK